MKIVEWPRFLEVALPFGGIPSAITVGIFDGVHRGHVALIQSIVSHNERAMPIVITFRRTGTDGIGYPGDIHSFRQRMNIFENLGVSVTMVIDLTESFKTMPGTDFLRLLKKKANMDFMTIGSNFHCGHKLDTDANAVREFNHRVGIQTDILEPVTEDGQPISSSNIRTAIAQGNLLEAMTMLGRPFSVDLSRTGSDFTFDMIGKGYVLPPPGNYSALLHMKKDSENVKKLVEVTIEAGNIIMTRESEYDKVYLESLEFLPQ